MKRIMAPLLILLWLAICGCTQNNGDIGPVFGSWSLVEIYEGETPLALQSETVFSFQNEVVRVQKIETEFNRTTRYGNFRISDDVMIMTFLNDLSSEGHGTQFLMPGWLYFPEGEMPLRFDILTLNGNHMVLCLDNDGKKYVYKFERTW